MPQLESQKKTKIFSLTETVLEAFCDDISSMFGVSLECEALQQQEQADIEDLRKKFRKISAAFRVSSKGFLDGDFWVLLDTVGLFVLSGVFVMLPEKVVAQRAKSGTIEEANNIDDALGEVGNLLVGSWDRVYREELDGHEHLLQTHTAVNKDWASLQETLDISDESIGYQTFKIDVGSYDPVNMTIVYPQSLFDESTAANEESQESDDLANSATENSSEVSQETTPDTQIEEPAEKTEVADKEEPKETAQTEESTEQSEEVVKEEPQAVPADVDNSQEEKQLESKDESQNQEDEGQESEQDETEEKVVSKTPSDEQEDSSLQDDIQAKADGEIADDTTIEPEPESSAQGPVSQAIKEMVSGNDAKPSGLKLNASDIMIKDVVWASKEDSVEKIISLMQSRDTDYVLIGSDQVVEGVVSGSDIKGAISPYLQSMFANWKRPQDIATLQIKAKWIMSCAVNTVALDAKFSAAARLLYEKDLNVLPVTDKSGKVCGVITSDEVMRIFMSNIGIDADRPIRRAPIL